MHKTLARLNSAACALAVTACVYTPSTVHVYDKECDIRVREAQLDVSQMNSLGQCSNEGCIGQVISAGFVSAGSAIVSGSIVIVANIAYWFEKQQSCKAINNKQVITG